MQTAKVQVVEHKAGMGFFCRKCRRCCASGKFAIGVSIGAHRYFVAPEHPLTCCGEEKRTFLVFADNKSAEAEVEWVIEMLERDGNTANLRLVEAARVFSAPVGVPSTAH